MSKFSYVSDPRNVFLRRASQAFVDARLATSDSDDYDYEATAEVAHEALLRQWTPLRDAIEDSRASLRLRSELEREAADWDLGGRDGAYLVRGGQLAAFEEWVSSHNDELTTRDREFLEASRALAEQELEAAQRSSQRQRRLADWTGEAGDPAEARRLLGELLSDVEPTLGPKHPETVTIRRDLAYWTGEAGEPAEAQRLLRELLPDVERVFGPMRTPDDDHYLMIAEKLFTGDIVPFLGAGVNLCGRSESTAWEPGTFAPSDKELAAYLARAVDYPMPDRTNLGRVFEYIGVIAGTTHLYGMLHGSLAAECTPTPLHRLLASLPARIRDAGEHTFPLIVTTNYDCALERALEAGELYDLVTYIADGPDRGLFRHTTPSGEVVIHTPYKYTQLRIDNERPVALKVQGSVDLQEKQRDSFVVTENEYTTPRSSDLRRHIPLGLLARMSDSHFLFLGCSPRDRSFRVIKQLWPGEKLTFRSWVIQPHPRELDEKEWGLLDVEMLHSALEHYTELLDRRLTTLDTSNPP